MFIILELSCYLLLYYMVYYKNLFIGYRFSVLLITCIMQLIFLIILFLWMTLKCSIVRKLLMTVLCLDLRSNTDSVFGLCTANFTLVFEHRLCESCINQRPRSIHWFQSLFSSSCWFYMFSGCWDVGSSSHNNLFFSFFWQCTDATFFFSNIWASIRICWMEFHSFYW